MAKITRILSAKRGNPPLGFELWYAFGKAKGIVYSIVK